MHKGSSGWLCLTLAMLWLAACAAPPEFRGMDLGGTPSPDFNLTDQNGSRISLADLEGKVVALTFMFTQCPDVCPLTAEKFRQAAGQLGPEAEGVAFVAISLDPEGDTPERVADFLEAHQLTGQMLYLTGSPAELEPVWKSYFLFVATPMPAPGHNTLAPAPSAGVGSMVGHTDSLVLLDKSGGQRVNLHSDVAVDDLVYDVRLLLKE